MSKAKFIVVNLSDAHWTTALDTEAEATALAEQLAADHPGEHFNVYALVSQSYAEAPVKVRPPVVTKDRAALEAETPHTEEIKK